MRKYFTFILFALFTLTAIGQTGGQKTLVKTFGLNGNATVILDFNGKVEVKEWSENSLRVYMEITLENSTVRMLKYLLTQGRYNLATEETEEGLVVHAPALNEAIILSKDGTTLQENIVYTVFVPSNIKTVISNEASKTESNIVESASAGDK